MLSPTVLIIAAVFVAVSALIMGLMFLLGQRSENRLETRLETFTRAAHAKQQKNDAQQTIAEALAKSHRRNILDELLERVPHVDRLLEQADVAIPASRLLTITVLLAAMGLVIGFLFRLHWAIVLALSPTLGSLPLAWLWWRRRKRLKLLAAQLPEALDMLSRSLRAGQSLASGFGLVAREIPAPLGREFGRIFEEQNLGIPLEESLRDMADRIPNMDLKFFATAVVLQRQTGGDLAEILDRISSLIRERFNIWGQVQALTGEGRLSGIVLMALPVVIFLAVYYLNRDYIMLLFTDPMGKKMLATAIIMQVIGALVIRKIVNIKV